MRPSLTPKEDKLFRHVRAELVEGRPAPTYGELLVVMGIRSKSGINRIVTGLVEKGYLTVNPMSRRSLRLAPGADAYTIHLPPDVDAKLSAHVVAWASTPQHVIVAAVTEYLARQP